MPLTNDSKFRNSEQMVEYGTRMRQERDEMKAERDLLAGYVRKFLEIVAANDKDNYELDGRLADSLCFTMHHRLPDSEGACIACEATVELLGPIPEDS